MKGTYRDLVSTYTKATGAELVIESMIATKKVTFPAFLTNLSQDFKSTWNSENVYGRMDPIVSFQNTVRTIQVAFNVPAASVDEAIKNQQKFSSLAQMLYPAYLKSPGIEEVTDPDTDTVVAEGIEGPKTMAKSPLVRVKFGNLIRSQDQERGLLGYLDGISFKPTLALGMFAEGDGNFYAKNFELTFTLTVLHEDDLGFDAEKPEDWLGPNGFDFPF